VATAEFYVPGDVREVRLWTDSPASGPSIGIALQHRVSKPYQLSESQYLEFERRVAGTTGAFPSVFEDSPTGENRSFALRELRNHWLPLLRLLQAHQQQFAGSVATRSVPTTVRPAGLRRTEPGSLARAEDLASQGDWLPALEIWSDLLPQLNSVERRAALRGRVGALQHLGESYLAEHELRGTFAHDADAAARHEAERLVANEANRIPAYAVEIDMIEDLRRVFYHAKRIARAVIESEAEAEHSAA